MKHIAIIGNGISGVTAARHIRKLSNHKITLISAETEHFFSRTALMYVYMGHMKYEHIKPYEDYFWEKNKINLRFGKVLKIAVDNKQLIFDEGADLSYDELILACGSKPNKFDWPGQDAKGVQGLYSWQDLQSMEQNTKNINRAVIIGGGLIGVEMAEMLATRNIPVTFLVREGNFWGSVLPEEEGRLVSNHILSHHIDLRFNEEMEKVIVDKLGRAAAVKTKKGEVINCEFVGLTAGVTPHIDFLKGSKINLKKGVLVNKFLETNISNVYAIGDCAEFIEHPTGRKNIEQVWYTGKMMGETVAQTICGNQTAYQPGIWFNSAKFFDIEYQTYGWVWNELKENESQLYWEHPNGKKCIKLVYDKHTKALLGCNGFGIRLKHQTFDFWIRNKISIKVVVSQLETANFDPEFYENNFPEIKQKFNSELKQNT